MKLSSLVIWALFTREIKAKIFDTGVFSIFSPFVFQLIIWHIVYFVIKHKNIDGMSISLFILASYTPFWIMEKLAVECANVFALTKGSLAFKRIKIFDAVMATALFILLCAVIVFICFLVGLKIFGDVFQIYKWEYIFYSFIVAVIFGLGAGFISCVFGAYVKNIPFIYVYILFRLVYFGSGIFFPVAILPMQIQNVLLLNPVLHLVEISRYAFIPIPLRSQISFEYPLIFSLLLFFVGIIIYYLNKDVFLRKAFE